MAWRAGLLAVIVSVASVSGAAAQDREQIEDERLAPLRLVQQVTVLIEDLTPDAERVALTRDVLHADASARLRLARVRVAEATTFPPFLYVQVSVLCNTSGTCAIDVSSAMVQDVYLLQAASRASRARTWSTGRLALAPRALVAERVREVVREQADLFAADVLAARQRFAPAKSEQ
jgi:hypothetical protein